MISGFPIRPYFVVFTTTFGLTGNTLSIIVFLRHQNWRPAGIHYLFVLAFSDSANLILYILSGVDLWGNVIDVFKINDYTCLSLMTFYWYTWFISTWTLVIFTIERWYSVTFPLRSVTTDFTLFRKRILAALFIGLFIIASPYFFMYGVIVDGKPPNEIKTCYKRSSTFDFSYYYMELGQYFSYVTPAFLVTLFNIMIVATLARSKWKGGKHGGEETNKNEFNIAKTLMIISTLFVITTMPGSVIWTYHNALNRNGFPGLSQVDVNRLVSFAYMGIAMNSINFSMNFVIYAAKFDFFLPTLKTTFKIRA